MIHITRISTYTLLIWMFASLVVGAMINLGVAWSIAWDVSAGEIRFPSEDEAFSIEFKSGDEGYFVDTWYQRWPNELRIGQRDHVLGISRMRNVECDELKRILPSWSKCAGGLPYLTFERQYGNNFTSYRELATGWPWCSFRGEYFHAPQWAAPTSSIEFPYVKGVVILPAGWTRDESRFALPFIPVWPGFAMNTVLFAIPGALLVLSTRIPGMLIRSRRRHAGRCSKCGYPAGTSLNCTECGQPNGMSGIHPNHVRH